MCILCNSTPICVQAPPPRDVSPKYGAPPSPVRAPQSPVRSHNRAPRLYPSPSKKVERDLKSTFIISCLYCQSIGLTHFSRSERELRSEHWPDALTVFIYSRIFCQSIIHVLLWRNVPLILQQQQPEPNSPSIINDTPSAADIMRKWQQRDRQNKWVWSKHRAPLFVQIFHLLMLYMSPAPVRAILIGLFGDNICWC